MVYQQKVAFPLEVNCSRHEALLVAKYGALLTLTDVATLLRYPTPQAAQKARMRGTLPIQMKQIPSRRGWFATTHAMAEFLARLDTEVVTSEES